MTKTIVAWVLGVLFAANGAVMLGWPAAWYAGFPGVSEHGSFNAHFIRDIGVVEILTGVSLIWATRRPWAWPAAMALALFQAIHAFLHLLEAVGGHVSHATGIAEVTGLGTSAALALWIAWPVRARLAGEGEC